MVYRSVTTTHRTDCTLPSQRNLKKIGVGGRENHKQTLDPKWPFSHSCLLHLPPPSTTQQNSTAMLLLAVPALHNIACCIPNCPSLPFPTTRQNDWARQKHATTAGSVFPLTNTYQLQVRNCARREYAGGQHASNAPVTRRHYHAVHGRLRP